LLKSLDFEAFGAGDEARTRYLHLGKVYFIAQYSQPLCLVLQSFDGNTKVIIIILILATC